MEDELHTTIQEVQIVLRNAVECDQKLASVFVALKNLRELLGNSIINIDRVGKNADFLKDFYNLESWLFTCVFTHLEKNFKGFLYLLSILVGWTDQSHVFRCAIVNGGQLFYHIKQLKSMEKRILSEHFQMLAQYSIAIIANCSQELEFDLYIEALKWGPVLKPWVTLLKGDITFHTKLLCGYVAPALSQSELSLLGMNMSEMIEALGLASTSGSLKASVSDFSFSALELLEGLEHLFISNSNLSAVAKMDLIPTFISLLLNGDIPEKKLACRLLWILLSCKDFVFDEDMYSTSLKEVLLIIVEDPNDESLVAHSKLLLSRDERIVKNDPTICNNSLSLLFSKSVSEWLEIGSRLGLNYASLSTCQSLDNLSVSKHIIFSLWLGRIEKLPSCKLLFQVDSFKFIESVLVNQQHQATLDSFHLKVDSPEVYWSTAFLSQCIHQTQKFLSSNAAKKNEYFPTVSHLWKQLSEFTSIFKNEQLIGIVNSNTVVKDEDFLSTLYAFFSLLFVAEKSDLATVDMRACFLHLVTILRDWSTLSNYFSVLLMKSGYLTYNCSQVLHWTQSNYVSKFVTYILNANLRILLNCCFELQFEVYATSFDWLSVLPRLNKSKNQGLQLCSKILGVCLASSLSDAHKSLWELNNENTDLMLTILVEAIGKAEIKIEEFSYYSVDILKSLLKFIQHSKENVLLLMKKKFITIVSCALSHGSSQERISVLLLLWELLSMPKAKKAMENDLELLTSLVIEVKSNSQDSIGDLGGIAGCVLYNLDMDIKGGQADFLSYSRVSYQYGKYQECINFCAIAEKMLKMQDEKFDVMILRAKALFKLYKSEQRYLCMKSLPKSEYYQLHKKCYEKTKEVIGILGMALDNDLLDPECSKIFDLAMMDYIHATNKLNDCKRCYLCRKKLVRKLPVEELEDKQQKQENKNEISMNTTPTIEVSPTDNRSKRDHSAKESKLIQSHAIPNSILERFTNIPNTPVNLKIFSSSAMGQQLEIGQGKIYAPKQMSRYMFCRSCEDILSSKGETQFVRDFFGKIYDVSDSQSPKQRQKIGYDSWLYHFCAGLIFRNLIWYDNTFVNEDELYQLLSVCRKVVLGSEASNVGISKLPDLYLLMTPMSSGVEEEELQYGSMNRVLNGGLQWYIGRRQLGKKSHEPEDTVLASFFLFHLGVINFLFKFKPSEQYFISPDFMIKVGEGVYFAPTEEERRSLIPPGMWAELQDDASLLEQESLEQSRPLAIDLEHMQLEEQPHSDIFGLTYGALKERVAKMTFGIQPNPSTHTSKRFNFLPAGFSVRPEKSPQSLILPNEHSIILHHTVNHGNGAGETIFIVRNNAQAKIYLLWHNYIRGLQYSVAFKLNVNEVSLGDVLVDEPPPRAFQASEFQVIIEDAKKKITSILPTILIKKGVFKLESLIYRADMLGILPCVDRRCENEVACWFCSSRCDVCLDIAGFDSSMQLTKDHCINLCSSNCVKFHPKTTRITQTRIVVATPEETPPPDYQDRCCPLKSTHKKLFHVYIEGISAGDELPYEGEVAVCCGDGTDGYPEHQPYGVYFSRSLQKQVVVEFFLNENFAPHSALPFASSDSMTVAVIAMLKEDGSIEQFIQLAHEEFTK